MKFAIVSLLFLFVVTTTVMAAEPPTPPSCPETVEHMSVRLQIMAADRERLENQIAELVRRIAKLEKKPDRPQEDRGEKK